MSPPTHLVPAVRNPARGFSLIEILLVVGIVAVLAIAVFLIYNHVSTKSTTKRAIAEMDQLALGTMSLWSVVHPPDPADPRNPAWYLHRAGYIPKVTPPTADKPSMQNVYGEHVTIAANTSAPGSLYIMYFMPRDKSTCLDIANHVRLSGLYAYGLMSFNGASVLLRQHPPVAITAPSAANAPTVENIVEMCSGVDGPSWPQIRFVPALK